MADKKTPEPEETPDETPVVEETTPEAPAAEAEPAAETPVEAAAPAEAVAEEAAPAEAAADEPAAEEPAAAEESTPEAPAAAEATPDAPPATPAVSGPKKHRKHLPRSLRHKHSKPKREQGGARKPITRLPKPESEPGRRQERRGVVVSDKGEKTIVVKVEMIRAHPKYKKVVRRSRKFHAHDEQNAAGVGDVVRIIETRPLSKTKNWRLAEIVEKAR